MPGMLQCQRNYNAKLDKKYCNVKRISKCQKNDVIQQILLKEMQ